MSDKSLKNQETGNENICSIAVNTIREETIFQQLQRDCFYILPKLLSSMVSPHFKQNEADSVHC